MPELLRIVARHSGTSQLTNLDPRKHQVFAASIFSFSRKNGTEHVFRIRPGLKGTDFKSIPGKLLTENEGSARHRRRVIPAIAGMPALDNSGSLGYFASIIGSQ